MIIGERLIKSTEQLLLTNGLHCLEIGWLKENRPDVLQAIHSERISLENLAQHFGFTSLWHAHFRAKILREWKELVDAHGLVALTQRWLTERNATRIFTSLRRLGMTMADGIQQLGQTEALTQFKGPKRGKVLWTNAKFDEIAKQIIEEFGCIPPSEFLAKNGFAGFTANISKYGPSIADIRKRYHVQNVILESLDGTLWDSLPETSCANYLIARGFQVSKGEPYPAKYSETYDRKRGFYDMHFNGTMKPYENTKLSVEIFGSGNYGGDNVRKRHYAETRKFKEDFHKVDDTFIILEYRDCYSDERLAKLLRPYIGLPPVVLERSAKLATTMASVQDQVLQQCRDIKSKLQTDKLPSSAWFDRTGPYIDRKIEEWEPRSFAKLVRDIERIKFTEIRKLLGENDIPSRMSWSEPEVLVAYKAAVAKYNVSPTTLYNRLYRLKQKNGLCESDMLLMSEMSKLSNAVAKYFKGRRHLLSVL